MDFPKTLEKIKNLSRTLGSGAPTTLYIESVAYQKSLIEQLRSENYLAREFKPQGSDKRARLSLTSPLIQTGKILFPRKGAEKLISQILNFGTEKHDDLVDAFSILILSIINNETHSIKGYYPLISEKELASAYSTVETQVGSMEDRRLGVIMAGGSRAYSTIVFRSEKLLKVLYHEMVEDLSILTDKILEFSKQYEIPLLDTNIFIDSSGAGKELVERLEKIGLGSSFHRPDFFDQSYGVNLNSIAFYDATRFEDQRSYGSIRLAEWLKNGGKIFQQPEFNDLLSVFYEENSSKFRIIDREKLAEEGIDSSIIDAVALVMITDKPSNEPEEPEESTP